MPLIKPIETTEATGKVAEIYEKMSNNLGFIPDSFKMFSQSEHVLDIQFSNLAYFIRHKSLGGKLLALIRYLVSEREECRYCVGMNAGILLQYGILPDQLDKIKNDPSTAPLDERELAMLLFVLKVVNHSIAVDEKDLVHLRSLGWSDGEIIDATYHATSQVGVDKLFNAFKVDTER